MWEEMMQELDEDGDGKISYEEFKKNMMKMIKLILALLEKLLSMSFKNKSRSSKKPSQIKTWVKHLPEEVLQLDK